MRYEDAETVLGLLAAAYPMFPMNAETSDLYLQTLAGIGSYDLALEAMRSWITREDRFPTASSLLAAISEHARRAQARALAIDRARATERGPDDPPACGTCDDTGWQPMVAERGGRRYDAVCPCPTCRPEEFAFWRGGHADSGHPVMACDHPRCKARADKIAAGRHR